MLHHKVCEHDVVIKIENMQVCADGFGLDQRNGKVRITSLMFVIESDAKNLEPKFFCTHCNKEVPPEEVQSTCGYCGKLRTLDNLFIMRGNGSLICMVEKKKSISNGDTQEKDFTPLTKIFAGGIVPPGN